MIRRSAFEKRKHLYLLYMVFILNVFLQFQSSQVSAESNINTSASKTEEKVGDGKYSSHSLDEVAGMIRSTISAYEVKVTILSSITCFKLL